MWAVLILYHETLHSSFTDVRRKYCLPAFVYLSQKTPSCTFKEKVAFYKSKEIKVSSELHLYCCKYLNKLLHFSVDIKLEAHHLFLCLLVYLKVELLQVLWKRKQIRKFPSLNYKIKKKILNAAFVEAVLSTWVCSKQRSDAKRTSWVSWPCEHSPNVIQFNCE